MMKKDQIVSLSIARLPSYHMEMLNTIDIPTPTNTLFIILPKKTTTTTTTVRVDQQLFEKLKEKEENKVT